MLAVLVPSMARSVHLTSSEPARAFFDTGTRLWKLGIGALAAIAAPRVATWGAGDVPEPCSAWPRWLALGVVLPTAVVVLAGSTTDDGVYLVFGLRPL